MGTNYEYRSEVLRSGLVEEAKQIKWAKYVAGYRRATGLQLKSSYSEPEAERREKLLKNSDDLGLAEAYRIIESEKRKKRNIRRRLVDMLSTGRCVVFITLTFSDQMLSLHPQTRKKYVKRWLREHCPDGYVANIDFGAQNEREHYHGFGLADVNDFDLDLRGYLAGGWYGGSFCHIEPVISNDTSSRYVSKYINKLSFHALKETNHNHTVIFSRKSRKDA